MWSVLKRSMLVGVWCLAGVSGTAYAGVTDVLTKVCAVSLMRHREVNALYAGDAIELQPAANVGIAVATERGLIVPVIQGCESLTVAQIASARADLVVWLDAGHVRCRATHRELWNDPGYRAVFRPDGEDARPGRAAARRPACPRPPWTCRPASCCSRRLRPAAAFRSCSRARSSARCAASAVSQTGDRQGWQ
mgnify:CR=1 FL=1